MTSRYFFLGPLALAALGFFACSDDSMGTSPSVPAEDSGTAAADEDAGSSDSSRGEDAGGAADGGCAGPIVTTPGETCIGFGAKEDSCDPACGQPYGYVCFAGAPPGFTGCRKASESAFGQTYCCPKNDCVAQPDLDAMCKGESGKPRRFQCPPDGRGGHVAAPAGCTESGSGSSEVEKFYCCP